MTDNMDDQFKAIVAAVADDYIGDLDVEWTAWKQSGIVFLTGFSDLIGAAEYTQKVLAKVERQIPGFNPIEVEIAASPRYEISLTLTGV